MSFINCYRSLNNMMSGIKIKIVTTCNILTGIIQNLRSQGNKNTPNIRPNFCCIAIKTNQIMQCYNEELRHHNHIRYAYFNLDKIIRSSLHNRDNLLIRIINNKGKNKDKEVTRFNIDFDEVIIKDNIIGGIATKEIVSHGENGHIILRIPTNVLDGDAKVVYVYNRGEV